MPEQRSCRCHTGIAATARLGDRAPASDEPAVAPGDPAPVSGYPITLSCLMIVLLLLIIFLRLLEVLCCYYLFLLLMFLILVILLLLIVPILLLLLLLFVMILLMIMPLTIMLHCPGEPFPASIDPALFIICSFCC